MDEHEYLGAIFTSNFTDDSDIDRQVHATYGIGNTVVRTFGSVKVELFKTYCYNMYVMQLWCQYESSSICRIRTAFNSIFRTLFNLGRMDRISAGMIN